MIAPKMRYALVAIALLSMTKFSTLVRCETPGRGSRMASVTTSCNQSAWSYQFVGSCPEIHGVEFTDDLIGWVVGSQGCVLHTTDGGVQWQPVDIGATADFEKVRFSDNLHGVITGRGVCFRTTNGGQVWEQQERGPGGEYAGSLTYVSADKLFSCSSFSNDSGKFWLLTDPISFVSVSIDDGTHGAAMDRFGNVFMSSDNGYTWPSVAKLDFGYNDWNSITYHASSHVLLAAGLIQSEGSPNKAEEAILRSSDDGAHWEVNMRLGAGIGIPIIRFVGDRLYAITSLGVSTSDDLGLSWTESEFDLRLGNVLDFSVLPSGIMSVVGDGNSLVRSRDPHRLQPAISLSYPNHETPWIPVTTQDILPEPSAALTFRVHPLRAGIGPNSISYYVQFSEQQTVACAPNRTVISNENAISIDHLKFNTMYYWRANIGRRDGRWLGEWTEIDSFLTGPNEGVNNHNPELLTFGAPTSSSSWHLVSWPGMNDMAGIRDLFLASASGAFSYSAGAGYHSSTNELQPGSGYWMKLGIDRSVSVIKPTIGPDSIQLHPGWNLIGSGVKPIRFVECRSNPPGIELSDLYGFRNDNWSGYWVADSIKPGNGYWVHSTGDGWLLLTPTSNGMQGRTISIHPIAELPPSPPDNQLLSTPAPSKPVSYNLSQNFPNPFNPSTQIAFDLPVKSHVQLTIYNTLGQLIATLVNEEREGGSYTVAWNPTIATGVYFYKVEAVSILDNSKSFSFVRKMILIR